MQLKSQLQLRLSCQLQMSDEWITGAQISAQSPSSVYRIVYSVIKSPVALVACCVVSDCRSTHRSVIHNRASFVCHKSSWIMSGAGYLFICCSCSCSCLPGHSTQGTKHRHMRLNTAKITKAQPNRRLLGLEFGKHFELISRSARACPP